MQSLKLDNGFSYRTGQRITNYGNDHVWWFDRPFNKLNKNYIKSIKVVNTTTQPNKFIFLIFEETNKFREFKIVWSGELSTDGKYGTDIRYAENLNIKCPENTYLGFIVTKGSQQDFKATYTDELNQPMYLRYQTGQFNLDHFKEGFAFDTKVVANGTSGWHLPMEIEYESYSESKILFKDESGDFKKFVQDGYVNMAKANQTSTHISSSATHPNHPDTLWNCFDGDDKSGWISASGNSFPKHVTYDFGNPTMIDRVELRAMEMVKFSKTYGLRDWTLLGSNDNAKWTEIYKINDTTTPINRDNFNLGNGSHLRYVNFTGTKPVYRYYKFEFYNARYHISAPYDYSVGLVYIGLMRYVPAHWESIGKSATSDDYMSHGMSKFDVGSLSVDELAMLIGDYSVNVFDENLNVKPPSIVKDMDEHIWLENVIGTEFDVITYSENLLKNRKEYIVDDGKRTLQEHLSSEVEVNIFSEDQEIVNNRVKLTKDHTPLDDISGDVEVLEYSEKERSVETISKNKFKEDISHKVDGSYVDSIDIDLSLSGVTKKIINY
ncbi:discoidin domain-containing protein [Paenibacillus agilis]|uniref:Discoidin domain-containing protein n=1 Tax=Paenibacillus agilis TaxID=3020863 RepID=A0A559IEM0_9BACL|nr:discoidin domain-containing protein [Paenibacillus agilis]TVX86096.1 discoidin domain-containing protein [Paenibacillus agilis]